jgi:peptide/nickel transport system permease protein
MAPPALAGAIPLPIADQARGSARRMAWMAPLLRERRIVAGVAILTAVSLMALFADHLGTVDPRALDIGSRLLPTSAGHPFGTDQYGRDLYSRVVFGARVSLIVGIVTAVLSCIIGTFFGLLSAASRFSDAIVMRFMDGLMSIPPILLAVALIGVAGGSITNVVAAVTLVELPRVARLVRGVALSLREQPYVEAAVAAGSPPWRIVVRHILPSILSPLAVQFAFVWAAAMLIEAALSFIGAGLPPSTPSWGNIMSEAKALWQVKPSLIFIPAAMLSVTVLGVNLLGEGLRRAFDPRRGH